MSAVFCITSLKNIQTNVTTIGNVKRNTFKHVLNIIFICNIIGDNSLK